MEIFPHRKDRLPFRLLQQPRHQGLLRFLSLPLRRQAQRGITLRQGHREQRSKEWHDVFQGQAICLQHQLQLAEFRLRGLVALPLQEPLQVVDYRVQGAILMVGGTAKHDPRRALAEHTLAQHPHQA